ncbi:Guanine nucleotide exchange factor for Cdc42p [Mucor circinelloides]
MIDMPMPSFSITNKPSSGTSLYHTCRSVLDKLALVEGMTYYLDFENLSLITSTTGSSVMSSESGSTTSSGNLSNDPLTKLWELCRRGAPLATLFNALNPAEPLKLDFTQNQQLNECKKTVYHFIVACRNQLEFKEEDVFTLSDLYKDNTNGFVKVVNTIDLILQLLEEKGIICTKDSANRNSLNAPKDTRDKVVHEMLETERKYVQDLEILQNYMRELQIQEVLNPDTIHYLFGNLNTLVDFQRRFLIYLEEIGEKPAEEQNFGALFSQMEDQFAVYEPYCANYFSAQDLVVQEAPKLQKLAGILNPVYELPSMLIKPVQRICKYPLLLNQLIKSMKPDWPHYEDMEEGLESVRRVTEKVNETQRKHENIQVVDDLKRRVDEMRTAQIDSFGSLLLHDKLVMQQSDESDKEMYIFFFERTMLICKESKDATKNKTAKSIKKKRRGSLQPKGLIVMSKILSVRNTSTGEGNWCLRVDWKDGEVHTVTLRFRNEEQVKLWESTLKRRMSPMKSTVSNTQLASMKNAHQQVPASLRTDDDDEYNDDAALAQRSRSNSLSAHLLNSISGRPKIPRNMSADQAGHGKQRYAAGTNSPLPRTSSSANTHNAHDYYYPASPPPSNPSSPTTSSRASQSSTTSSIRVGASPLADIASKFMSTGSSTEDDYRQFPLPPPPPPHVNRSQSHSAASPYHTISATTYQQQQQQLQQQQLSASPRLRSQSSPNIHHNNTSNIEDAPQLPFNSRTLYQTPPSPLDSPIRDSNISYRTTNSNTSRISDLSNQQVPLSPISSISGCVKIKLNYNDGIYVVMCSSEVLYYELMDKVERKIRLVANLQPNDVLRLKYQDEDGDLITINSDDDVQMAFESRGNLNTINLFVSV